MAERKVERLLDAQAIVTLVSPVVTEGLETLAAENRIDHIAREYREGDLEGNAVVIAATNSRAANAQVYKEAVGRNVLVNSVDDPENSSFYVPAIVQRGDLQVAVSTSGKAPFFAKRLRQFLDKKLYAELDRDLLELSCLRKEVLDEPAADRAAKADRLARVLGPRAEEMLRKIDTQ